MPLLVRARPPVPIQAVLFDLDGTLVDSLADIARAMNHALESLGHPRHPLERFPGWVGDGVIELARRALPPHAHAQIPDAVTAFRAYYADHLVDLTVPFPGIPRALERLTARGVALAVLSNKFHPTTCGIVSRLFGDARFRCVFGERAGIPLKPDPTAALEIARTLGVLPEACAFVGDTSVDVRTALAARMHPVGVSWGFRGAEALRGSGAAVVLEHADELLPYLFGKVS